MEYTVKYSNMAERNVACDEATTNGYVMLHDDFDPDWEKDTEPHGTLTFAEPAPPTAGELALDTVKAETDEANDQALVAYQGWSNLSSANKDKVLKALLGDFISRNRDKYIQ